MFWEDDETLAPSEHEVYLLVREAEAYLALEAEDFDTEDRWNLDV